MKTIYWRPYRLSLWALVVIAGASVLGMVAVEWHARRQAAPHREEMLKAAELAARSMTAVKEERLRRGIEINSRFDPAESGLIGLWMTPTTSVYGNLHAKQTSVNPNFAAVVVRLLREAGFREGDAVAVGFSGSFPALNVCVCAALETLRAKPLVVSSLAASQWGANHPDLLWVDMEAALHARGLIGFHSAGVSLGGRDDSALGMSVEGVALLRKAAARHDLPLIEGSTYDQRVEGRMALYQQQAGTARIAAYINVGGATASVGTPDDKRAFDPGLSNEEPEEDPVLESVMARFAARRVPIVHFSQIQALARQFGLPRRPRRVPAIGEGRVYGDVRYSRPLAAGILLALACMLVAGVVITRRRGSTV